MEKAAGETKQRQYLAASFAGCLAALALLLAATAISLVWGSSAEPVGQEAFETISDPAAYAGGLARADGPLRAILFVDSLFIIAYLTAVGFATAAFAGRCRPAAWFGGLAIVAVAILDALENATMVQSLDLLAVGAPLTLERIAWQASISAMKWQTAALSLFALTFTLPHETILERVLVWAMRLGLPLAVPLFVMNTFGLREIAPLGMGLAMVSGLALLAAVTRSHLRES